MIDNAIESGIIEPEELYALLSSEERASIKILDASFSLPNSNENPYQNYLKERIADAVFFDVKDVADHTSTLPNMLPTREGFENHVSKMGVGNDDVIVIYGQSGMVMGPARAWWMFRVFGHHRVCVLNGGLPAWRRAGYGVSTDLPAAPAHTNYSADYDAALVRSMDDLLEITPDAPCTILDARPASRFSGETPEPRAGMRSGHIPGSKNLPCIALIRQDTGKLKAVEDIAAILHDAGFDSDAPTITTCGSGVTACVIALALFHIGHKDIPVYDGSWSEWGNENAPTTVEKH